MTYRICYTDGQSDSVVATFDAALALCADRWPELEYGHAGDLSGGGDRTLVWASEDDSIDDDGARAVASIRREPEEPDECTCEPGSACLCPSCERKAEEQPHGF